MGNAGPIFLFNKMAQGVVLGSVLIIGAMDAAHATGMVAPKDDRSFEQYDTNQDGFVSPKEAIAMGMVTQDFDAADGNHDGNLSNDEYIKAAAVNERLKISPSKKQ
ncbi:hypothetical protein CAP31_09350 [Sulfuriferula sp. AH1]|uniref:hypothetical protein n=1 Tax=Sulfuriferula sp. AH1 TaxID=1985873 RepID=UPI000B3B12E7|nr:hypothetical protein [Sulfuriferula sp. AH1]ARU31859.1 hypothetical protein CAP31_09350 [Sulfuriferula sp. AH1]